MTQPVIIDKGTAFSIGLFVTLGAMLVGGAFWVSNVNNQLNSIVKELQAIRISIDGNWSKSDMILWVRTLKDMNPDLRLPPMPN